MKARLATELANKYSPKIYRNDGRLDSDYDWTQTQKAVREALQRAIELAGRVYGDEVQCGGQDEPYAVGYKIQQALKKL